MPLSKEYAEFMQKADGMSPAERDRQRATIRKFDHSGIWRDPEVYVRFIGPPASVGFLLLAFRHRSNPQDGGDRPGKAGRRE